MSRQYVDTALGPDADRRRVSEFLDGLKDTRQSAMRDAAESAAIAVAVGYGISAYQRYRNAKKVHR